MSKVSIYMSSFNHGIYLQDSINSVLNQTFSDFELFIVDDASMDDSWSIINGFNDPRIHAIRNEINRNDKEVMRKVISGMAMGEYIAIQHSDNVWEPEKLQKQVDFLDVHPEVGAVFTEAQFIDEDGAPVKKNWGFLPNRTRHEWLTYFFYKGNAFLHPTVLIRKNCYTDCGFYRNGFVQMPDFEMWVRLCLQYEIYVIPEMLTRYRVRADELNISGNRRDSRLRSQIEYLQILENYRKIPSYQELVKIFPTAQRFNQPGGHDIDFILGMVALEEKVANPINHLFGVNLLFEVFDDPDRAGRIKELYGFTRKNFIALTGKYDVFSTETKSDLYLKLTAMEQSVQVLTDQLREITGSKKWKSVLWMSRIGNVLAPRSSFRYRILKSINGFITFPINFYRKRKSKQVEAMIRSSGLFDEAWYLENNPDVDSTKIDPLEHYLLFGGFEGRDPGPKFSSRDYLLMHKDIKEGGINPLVHYLERGREKGNRI